MTSDPHEPAPSPPRRERPVLRWLLGAVLVAAVVVLLFTVVFPWFQEYTDDPTLEGAGRSVVAAAVVR